MSSLTHSAILFAVLALELALSSVAHGQALPAWLLVKPSQMLIAEPVSANEFALGFESAQRQSRARSVLAAGAGFLVSAAVHAAYAAPMRRCGSGRTITRSLKAAGVFGGIGLAMTIGGGTWLAMESRRYGYHSSWQQRLGAVGVAALSAVPSQALLFGLLLGEGLRCD